ncbi:hypothetical protein [Simplicispira psychrophila]|uniref:hypothetical protein n=1 Tax=Simplicispira psychrophila TaxID=80882 RepID=UPI0012EB9FF4|nr:hypothetical protein [Simplicispira psychrophila]
MKTKKLYYFAIIASLIFSVSGCSSIKKEYAQISIPSPGDIATKNIGEELISQKLRTYALGLTIPENYKIGKYTLLKGTYQLEKENEKGQWFEVSVNHKDSENVLVKKDDGSLCVDKICQQLQYSIEKSPFEKKDIKNSFQKTILYNGKIGNKVTVSYREFSDGLARSAFTNEVSYDLSESKIIGYKGARLEVIKATNTDITFKVISGFD